MSVDSRQLTIRQVDAAGARERILAVLGRNLPTAAVPERIDWLYRSNPDGAALVWLAEDADGQPVGSSAAYPRRVRVHGRVVRALTLGDFAFDRAYRTLGPGLRLLRATLEPVKRGEYAFSCDFPSRPMRAIYHRMQGVDLGGMEWWTRPVAPGRRLRHVVRAVTGLGAPTPRGGVAPRRGPCDLEVEPLVGECSGEFDVLDARLARLGAVVGVRDATYLNWRYLSHTMWPHVILCARRRGCLVGYAVLRPEQSGTVTLLDLHADVEDGVRQQLAERAVEWVRARGADTISVEVLAGTATARLARAIGFARRGTGVGPIPFVPPDSSHALTLTQAASWWMMGGDRDI